MRRAAVLRSAIPDRCTQHCSNRCRGRGRRGKGPSGSRRRARSPRRPGVHGRTNPAAQWRAESHRRAGPPAPLNSGPSRSFSRTGSRMAERRSAPHAGRNSATMCGGRPIHRPRAVASLQRNNRHPERHRAHRAGQIITILIDRYWWILRGDAGDHGGFGDDRIVLGRRSPW